MITTRTKVIIATNSTNDTRFDLDSDRNKYVGHTGVITEIYHDGSEYPYVVKFDDEELQKKNDEEGTWLWSKKELIKLDSDNKDYTR